MCGFVGFIDQGMGDTPVYDPKSVIKAMADAIAHRGPDGEGYFVEADSGVALGFRRLSIIDLDGGDQPMFSEDGNFVLCFNGEIYNFQDLRAELIGLGHTFASFCDSEVALHGYEEWGADILPRLRGMFAFVIYDRRNRRLFAARDAFGIKPLYYQTDQPLSNQIGSSLLFASEIKGMIPHPKFHKACNEARIPHYLCFEYLPDHETMFERVYKLPAGHYLTWEDGALCVSRWFTPRFDVTTPASERADVAAIADAIRESVRAHAVADVEVGSFLSAGVDSSLVAFEANRLMDLKTFSVGWAEQQYSELDTAASFAEITGINNRGRTISAEEFFAAVPSVQYAMDEPLPNPSAVPLWFLTHFAAEFVKVVMSGEGADELFGGYPLYRESLTYEPYMKVPAFLRRLAGGIARRLPRFHGRRFLKRGAHPLKQRFARVEYVFAQEDWEDILAPRLLDAADPYSFVEDLFNEMPGYYDELTATQTADMQTWLCNDILLKADKMSMAASLELRVPFLDHKVWEVARGLPSCERLNGSQTKTALRQAAAETLPPQTAAMPKLGFLTPLNDWLRQDPWKTKVAAVLNGDTAAQFFNRRALNRLLDDHVFGRAHNMGKIWAIYCFCIWYDGYFQE